MGVEHGFHATLTARPGKGDEVVEFLLNAPSLTIRQMPSPPSQTRAERHDVTVGEITLIDIPLEWLEELGVVVVTAGHRKRPGQRSSTTATAVCCGQSRTRKP